MRSLVAASAWSCGCCLAGLLSQVVCGVPSASAADLRDLDDRVGELEQMVARSGSRQLRLNAYGQVNRAVLFWNDGFDSGTYGVDNHASSTRFGFVGQAVVAPGWSVGYRFEIETPFPSSDEIGLSRQWLAAGKTTLYVDHGIYKNFNVGEIMSINPGTSEEVPWGTLVDTEVRRWGFGIEQAVDAANLLLYAEAHIYDPTVVGYPCTFDPDPNDPGKTVCGGDPSATTKLPAAAWQGIVIGARIQF